jgi:hypothetical protein
VFLDELRSLQPLWDDPWLLCDDFNLLYKSSDKSNSRLNRRLMGKFRRFLQDMEQSELHLHDRLFTWSNEQVHPTLSRIDRAVDVHRMVRHLSAPSSLCWLFVRFGSCTASSMFER